MAASRRKQEERNLRALREQGALEANRTCFDCRQRGTTYINMTTGAFVCTSCSGLLRGLNPPHRVKSISMASFTQEEVDQIKSRGNQYCSAVWLGLYDPKLTPFPDTKDEHKIRDFMITKYEKKRFYIDPSVALKIMPPQDNSATSSSASTPSSETSKSGPTPAPASVSVSRPSVANSQSLGSVSSGGLSAGTSTASKSSVPRSSASLDLLSDLGGSQPRVGDPFASPTQVTPVSQPSFANFENANIFTNTPGAGSTTSSRPQPPPGPHLPFSSNPLTPLTPHSTTTLSSSSSTSSLPSSAALAPGSQSVAPGGPPQDRYAALKDLDEELKTQKECETSAPTATNGGVSWPIPNGGGSNHNGSSFGSSTMNGSVFGSPPPGGVFGAVNGGGGVMGTPPTAPNPWQNFSGANPFSGCNNGGSPWVNGGTSMGNTATHNHTNPSPHLQQQGFGSVVQPNPFGATPDPNFNQFGGGTTLNGTGSGPAAGGGWASFTPHHQSTPQPSKMQWVTANGTPNPFMAAPQMPSSGSSYNPFL